MLPPLLLPNLDSGCVEYIGFALILSSAAFLTQRPHDHEGENAQFQTLLPVELMLLFPPAVMPGIAPPFVLAETG